MALDCEMMYRVACDGKGCGEVADWGEWAKSSLDAENNAESDGYHHVGGRWLCETCHEAQAPAEPDAVEPTEHDRKMFEVSP